MVEAKEAYKAVDAKERGVMALVRHKAPEPMHDKSSDKRKKRGLFGWWREHAPGTVTACVDHSPFLIK